MKKQWVVFLGSILILGVSLGVFVSANAAEKAVNPQAAAQAQPSFTIPTFDIITIKPNKSITIRTHHFPAKDTFVVRMGAFGTMGIGGIKVATTKSGKGGSFTKTYTIPAKLAGAYRIAIRLESPTSGYYAYNWFYNDKAKAKAKAKKTPAKTKNKDKQKGYQGIPTVDVVSVVRNKKITIKMKNLPPKDTFKVRIHRFGTMGVGGELVGTVQTGKGGSLTRTFDIPKRYKGKYQLAVRIESPKSGFYAYNWFYNAKNKPAPTTKPKKGTKTTPKKSSGYVGYPTFKISAVKKNKTVTVKILNLPPNDTFVVRMNRMWTYGIGGQKVASFKTGKGGKVTKTFNIPAFLKNQGRIAIRIESPSSGFYAFNWFYNSTAP